MLVQSIFDSYKFVMTSLLTQLSIFQYKNLVGLAYRAQSVSNDNRCPALHEVVQGLLHQSF